GAAESHRCYGGADPFRTVCRYYSQIRSVCQLVFSAQNNPGVEKQENLDTIAMPKKARPHTDTKGKSRMLKRSTAAIRSAGGVPATCCPYPWRSKKPVREFRQS